MPERINLHATVVVANGTGLLIKGRSGSGKTSLALTLIDLCRARGSHACFVADDQVWLSVVNGRVVAHAPAEISGLVEMRGYGPALIAHEPRAVIDATITLVDPQDAPRVHLQESELQQGIILPKLTLAAANSAGSARAVLAWIAEIDRQNT
jgi:serine kinase of HPr protein (carbohydrate metabolism regulator)